MLRGSKRRCVARGRECCWLLREYRRPRLHWRPRRCRDCWTLLQQSRFGQCFRRSLRDAPGWLGGWQRGRRIRHASGFARAGCRWRSRAVRRRSLLQRSGLGSPGHGAIKAEILQLRGTDTACRGRGRSRRRRVLRSTGDRSQQDAGSRNRDRQAQRASGHSPPKSLESQCLSAAQAAHARPMPPIQAQAR